MLNGHTPVSAQPDRYCQRSAKIPSMAADFQTVALLNDNFRRACAIDVRLHANNGNSSDRTYIILTVPIQQATPSHSRAGIVQRPGLPTLPSVPAGVQC